MYVCAVPRPNVSVYLSPVHVNVHQESCLWLVEFVHGLVRTVNIQLALAVKDESKSFLVSCQYHTRTQYSLPDTFTFTHY